MNPLKQGLKQERSDPEWNGLQKKVKEVNPLKQGLKRLQRGYVR